MNIKKKIKKIAYKYFKKNTVPVLVNHNKMLENKIAMITGGDSGIGYAIAEEFIKNGCKVIICGRNKTKLEKCIKKLGDNSRYIVLDVTNVKKIKSTIDEAIQLFDEKRIDILVNSAGVGVKNNFFEINEEEYDLIMNVNTKGTFFMTREMSNYMIENNIEGHILNVSSSSALRPAWTPYEMSKWSIRGFTLGAADTLSEYGITVNAIAPGPTATPMLNVKDGDNISIDTNLVGRYAMPNEIASLAVYMCSEMGRMIVGDTFYVTGGAGNILNRF